MNNPYAQFQDEYSLDEIKAACCRSTSAGRSWSPARLPHLRRSEHAHVLTLSPPVDEVASWLGGDEATARSRTPAILV